MFKLSFKKSASSFSTDAIGVCFFFSYIAQKNDWQMINHHRAYLIIPNIRSKMNRHYK